jgi:hypothetical protein
MSAMQDRPGDLLVHCLATRFGAAPDPALRSLPPHAWEALVAEANRQWLPSMLFDSLRALGDAVNPPTQVLERLRRLYLHHSFRNRLLVRELETVLRTLHSQGVEVAVLKGVDLITTVYPDPGVRGMTDIDVLVRRDRLAAAEQALVQLGYGPQPRPDMDSYLRRTNHIAPFTKRGAATIEVHWTIERATSPFAIDDAELWARARTIRIGAVDSLHLAPEHLILHLALHVSYHHRYARAGIKTLCDIAAIAQRYPQLDWPFLAETANRIGAGGFVFSALELTRSMLHAPIPLDAVRLFQHDAEDVAIVQAARPFMLTPPVDLPVTLRDDQPVEGRMDRLRRVWAGVFPAPARLRQIYRLPAGSSLAPLFYIFRPFDLLARRGRVVFQFLFRSSALQPTIVWRESQRRISRWVQNATTQTPK